MAMVVKRFDVYLINLDPTMGSEIKKTRPCFIISPDEMNRYINTVIVAPMSTQGRSYPTRVACRIASPLRTHWSNYHRVDVTIHFVRGNNQAGSRFLYLTSHCRIKINQID